MPFTKYSGVFCFGFFVLFFALVCVLGRKSLAFNWLKSSFHFGLRSLDANANYDLGEYKETILYWNVSI